MSSPYATFSAPHPAVVHVQVVGTPDDVNYPAYLEALAETFRARERFGLVFSTGKLASLPARYREMQSRWLADTQSEFEGKWVCAAFVVPSRVVRGVLMTLFWANRPYYAHAVLPDEAAALAWVRGQLIEAGVDVGDWPGLAW